MSAFKLLSLILLFTFAVVLFIFSSVFVQQIGDEQILTRIENYSQQASPALGVSNEMQTHISNQLTEYRAINIPYDLFFILSFLGFFGLSIFTAYKSREESFIGFFGFITFGLIIFLFIVGFIDVIKDWLIVNLIENFLEFNLLDTPITNYYLSNTAFINFIWAALLIIINKLNFSVSRDTDNIGLGGGFER